MLACSDTSLQNREAWNSKRKIFSAFSTHRKSQLPALIEVSRFKLWNRCFCLKSVVTNSSTLIYPAAVHSIHALTWLVMTGHVFLTFAAHDRNVPAVEMLVHFTVGHNLVDGKLCLCQVWVVASVVVLFIEKYVVQYAGLYWSLRFSPGCTYWSLDVCG